MFKHILSLRAVALFAGICLLALSGYGVFSSSLQGRALWPEKPMSSESVARDVKVDCGTIHERVQRDYQRRVQENKERAKRMAEENKAFQESLEKQKQLNEQREAQRQAEREAIIREVEKQTPAFRRQIKRGDYASSYPDGSYCRLVTNVSPPLAEVQDPGFSNPFFGGSQSPSRIAVRIDKLYPCKEEK